MAVTMKDVVFWDMTPCYPEDGGDISPKMSALLTRTTRRHIPEENTLNRLCSSTQH
jgi:hypothetical protein